MGEPKQVDEREEEEEEERQMMGNHSAALSQKKPSGLENGTWLEYVYIKMYRAMWQDPG